jgi:hypothetical protein
VSQHRGGPSEGENLMAEYLVSFRVASEDLALSEEKRRQSIYDAVLEVECWAETTSLLIIRCDQAIVELMRILTQNDVDPSRGLQEDNLLGVDDPGHDVD